MSYTDDAYTVAGESQQQSGLWPAGNYVGKPLRFRVTTSPTKGTPGISIWFDIQGVEKLVDFWLTDETVMGFTGDQLGVLGWNGDYIKANFAFPETVDLWMKHGSYKGRPKEEWNVSVRAREAAPQVVQAVDRACAMWKARKAAVPPAPATPAPLPPRGPVANGMAPGASTPPRQPAPPPRPAAATSLPPPPARPTVDPAAERLKMISAAVDQNSAWAVWMFCGCEDGDAFWRAAEAINTDPSRLTPDDWKTVATAAPPF